MPDVSADAVGNHETRPHMLIMWKTDGLSRTSAAGNGEVLQLTAVVEPPEAMNYNAEHALYNRHRLLDTGQTRQ